MIGSRKLERPASAAPCLENPQILWHAIELRFQNFIMSSANSKSVAINFSDSLPRMPRLGSERTLLARLHGLSKHANLLLYSSNAEAPCDFSHVLRSYRVTGAGY